MTVSNAANQAAWRKRQADKIERYEAALGRLDGILACSTKDWAQNMRKIISEALTPPKRAMKEMGDE